MEIHGKETLFWNKYLKRLFGAGIIRHYGYVYNSEFHESRRLMLYRGYSNRKIAPTYLILIRWSCGFGELLGSASICRA